MHNFLHTNCIFLCVDQNHVHFSGWIIVFPIYKCHENTNRSHVLQLSKAIIPTSELKYVTNPKQVEPRNMVISSIQGR